MSVESVIRGYLYLNVYEETARSIPHRKRLSNPYIGLDRPWSFQEFEILRFKDNSHIKVVWLSSLSTGCLCPQGNDPGTHFCAAGMIMAMKNSSDTIGNRNRDFPACSAVRQPTAPPRVFDQVHRPRTSGHSVRSHYSKCEIYDTEMEWQALLRWLEVNDTKTKNKRQFVIQDRYSGIFFHRNKKKIQQVMSALCPLSPDDGAYSGHTTVHNMSLYLLFSRIHLQVMHS